MNAVVAYIPVLHEGYRRFLETHGRKKPLYVVGRDLYADYRPLAKDIRALDPRLVASAIASWGICSETSVLTPDNLHELDSARLTLPDEDVSHQLVERFFPRHEVRYASAFLRWDKTKTVQMLEPRPTAPAASMDDVAAELRIAAEQAGTKSVDWWRQVGAAIRFAGGGEPRSASNVHNPHELSPYVVGDPRANFFKGVSLELSTASHAEARLIAQAARDGISTRDAVMYVTDFPCPPCAKLIAAAGISRLYFREGYAILDGQDVLDAAGVEIVKAA